MKFLTLTLTLLCLLVFSHAYAKQTDSYCSGMYHTSKSYYYLETCEAYREIAYAKGKTLDESCRSGLLFYYFCKLGYARDTT